MKVLVTGHAGYLGTLLTPRLSAAGHQVFGLDSQLFADCGFGVDAPPVSAVTKDLRDITEADLAGMQAVVHLAGLSNDPLGDLDPALTHVINHAAASRLALLARRAGVQRFIVASSCSVYGASESEDLLTEDAPLRPVTPYAEAKARMEDDVRELADDHFQPVFLRPATVYGVSPRIRFDLVLNNLVAWAVTSGQVLLKSDGQAWRPLLHALDLVSVVIALLDAPADRVAGQAFNLVRTDENYRVSELAELVAQTVPGSRVEFQAGYIHDKRNYRVSGERLLQALPELRFDWDVRRGAQQLYDAYIAQQLQPGDFEGPRYQRLAHLKAALAAGRIRTDLRPLSFGGKA